jgi:SAM-dependent methyltransferase
MSSPTIRPENTAIRRAGPSKPAKKLVESGLLSRYGVRRILDYGCGYGSDVAYLRARGFDATGYDSHSAFGFGGVPQGGFDFAMLLFVLNVLPTRVERLEVIHRVGCQLRPGGTLLMVARGAAEIEREAHRGHWELYQDGYLSRKARGMFQHGLSDQEMCDLAKESELRILADARLDLRPSTCLFAERP